jgi:hypothetical protein
VTAAGVYRADPVLLRPALSMAARGWHVFPCAPGTKRPALQENWQQIATTDPARIRRWWTCLPYNIGIACGPSMLIVIDLDVPHDGRADGPMGGQMPASGADTLAALCRRRGQPYPSGTFAVKTQSGGCHLYFAACAKRVRNSAGRLGNHLDVRADGGYVIGAGSRVGGRTYTALNAGSPAPFPPWIAVLLGEVTPAA